MNTFLLTFFWDPSPDLFTIPFINRPIYWYSIFFAIGFFTAYSTVKFLLRKKIKDTLPIDTLTLYLFVGMIVGARLVHVFFYDSWDLYAKSPIRVLYTWEGGLSSHGGALGVLIALLVYWKRHKTTSCSFLTLLDFLSIGAALAGGFIRIGNFFNQEILGTYTTGWYAVWFGHPMEMGAQMPCHPVQLYESLFYFTVGLSLFAYACKTKKIPEGKIAGCFFFLVFTFRFFIEFIKLPQSVSDTSGLFMGQLLSLPFALFGLYLLLRKTKTIPS